MKIGIVGLGYVGLPLAVAFLDAGHDVVGLDTDQRKVAALGRGERYIEDVPSERIAQHGGHLSATTDVHALGECDAVVIAVPTPLTENREPDLGPLVGAATALASVVRKGQLVVLESTTYPGTTRERLVPLLEESGLAAGRDFNVAFSPERIDPGRTDFTMRNTPKVVGGLTPDCRRRAVEMYSEICDEVVEAASTKPYGFMRFDPGPGMGGHCLPVDPFYLAWKARQYETSTHFIELAGEVNQNMPYFCVERITRALNDHSKAVRGSRVAVLGVSYKPGVGDLRESPALKIMRLLDQRGARLAYNDPFVPRLADFGLESEELGDLLDGADVAAIVTAHPGLDLQAVVDAAPLVVDFRGVTRGIEAPNLVRL